jgi:hypothetical protein
MQRVIFFGLIVLIAIVAWQMTMENKPSVQVAGICGGELIKCTSQLARDEVAQKTATDLCLSSCGRGRRYEPGCYTGCMEEHVQDALRPCKDNFFSCAKKAQPAIDTQELEKLWAQHMERRRSR